MKNEHHHWIVHIRISLGTTFQLKLAIESFWTKFTQKGCFPSKTVKTTIETSKDHNWILDILIIVATKLELKLTILIFFVQLCLKWCFPSKTEKVDTAIEFCVFEFVLELVLCHWILRIRINFFDQIAQKGCLRSKIEKSHLCTRLWLVLTILNLSARGLTDTMFLLLRREKKAHG